ACYDKDGLDRSTRGLSSIESEEKSMVESTLSYLSPIAGRPHYYLYDPPPGTPSRNTKGDRRPVTIYDGRELGSQLSLDEAGFLLADHTTAVENLYDGNAVR